MEIRRVQGDEFKQAIGLSDSIFRKEGHSSMGEAFPQVFSPYLGQSYGAFDGDKLVAFIGLSPSRLKIGEATVNAFSLGSVATEESYRGRGISTSMLLEIYDYIDRAGASLLFVSGDRGMYRRNHCHYFGSRKKYMLEAADPEKRAEFGGTTREGTKDDIFSIMALNEQNEVRYETNVWEWNTLFAASGYASIFKLNQKVFVAEKDGEVCGYFVAGIPDGNSSRQEALAIEWGGDRKAVYAILADLLSNGAAPKIEVKVPWDDALNEEIGAPAEEIRNGMTVYVVSAERLISQLMPYLSAKTDGAAEELSVVTAGDAVRVSYKGAEKTLSKEAFIDLLFTEGAADGPFAELFPVPLPSTETLHYA